MVQVKAAVHYFLIGKHFNIIRKEPHMHFKSLAYTVPTRVIMALKMVNKVDSQSKDNLPPLHQAIMKSDRSEISRLLAILKPEMTKEEQHYIWQPCWALRTSCSCCLRQMQILKSRTMKI
jgi:hypothetical protein